MGPRQRRREKRKKRFEEKKPGALKADIFMLSGCEDHQTSADVSTVANFKLRDPAEGGGGACTSTLLEVLYKDEETPNKALSFTEVLNQMRVKLKERNFSQFPQLSGSQPVDVDTDFDLVPREGKSHARRAVMVGINYIGHESGVLSGCHNDVLNMKKYIMAVHGFKEENIVVLMDDGEHESPTKENIVAAYKKIVADSKRGDNIFLHYSGHGCKVNDSTGDEADGFDEALCPVDYNTAGMILDDDLFEIIVKPLKKNVHVFCLYDCCHSGSVLDLPYTFKPGQKGGMGIEDDFNFKKLLGKVGEGDPEDFAGDVSDGEGSDSD